MSWIRCIDQRSALFLDFDGTLADLAPEPQAVRVAPELVPTLRQMHQRLSGALAVVSGRPIVEIDRFLAPLRLPVAGVHGAERRHANQVEAIAAPALAEIEAVAAALVERHPGVRMERKAAALALHYRQAPAAQQACLAAMRRAVGDRTDLSVLVGKCVVEVKPARVDKGRAVEAFLARPPFAGRTPVFVGDDVTDEAGFAAAVRAGGHAVKVGAGPTQAAHRVDSPAALLDGLRRWLQAKT
jgi:trehalose 6-phosphate phosphatase